VRLPAGLDIREATLDDLHLFESADKPLEVMLCKRLMDTGAKCLVALSDNQLAAYVWFAAQVDPAIHLLYLPLAHDEVYVFDSFTMPAFRRQGIQTVLHQIMFRMLRQRGYRRVLILVGLDNQPSLRMHDQLYQPIGRLTRIKLFRLMVFHYDPALPGHARRMIKWLGF
jgi:ribosomal protein S18 acetylase RimI-like enzyme